MFTISQVQAGLLPCFPAGSQPWFNGRASIQAEVQVAYTRLDLKPVGKLNSQMCKGIYKYRTIRDFFSAVKVIFPAKAILINFCIQSVALFSIVKPLREDNLRLNFLLKIYLKASFPSILSSR